MGIVLAFSESEPIIYMRVSQKEMTRPVIENVCRVYDVKVTHKTSSPIKDSKYCYCVKTARGEGINIPYGMNADDLQPNTTPYVGALALFVFPSTEEYPEGVPHVGLINEMNGLEFRVVQGNKIACTRTEEWLPWDYKYLKGFWSPERDGVAVSEMIIQYAEKYGADVELALNVACAESCTRNDAGQVVFDPLAQNPNSTAAGVYQFIEGTWNSMCEGNVFNPDDNINCATKIIAEGGIGHWNASRNNGFMGGWENEPYFVMNVTN